MRVVATIVHASKFDHGFSEVTPDIFRLNIRWDDNYTTN